MRSTTPRTFTFSFATTALLYLCLGLFQARDAFAAASKTSTASNELPPRRGSHISTGFVKPALLVPSSAGMAQNGVGRRREGGERNTNAMSNAEASRRVGDMACQQHQRRGSRMTDSYGLMSGMFDNECMQRHMNTDIQEEQ